MSYRTRSISLGIFLIAILALAGSSTGGFGCVYDVHEYTCEVPRMGRKDDAGYPDPCCSWKPCCPNPITDHFIALEDAIDLWTGEIAMMPDFCCMSEACPGKDPWKEPDDAGAPEDAGTGGGGGGGGDAQSSLCPGKCVTVPNEGWFPPVLLWFGSPDQEPQCPDQAPFEGYRGFADLVAPEKSCGICGCDAPAGECGLPQHLMAGTTGCNSVGIQTPFDAPAGWNGSCTAQDAIPGGAQCNGSPCVKSISIEPLTVTESGCTTHIIVPKDGGDAEPGWKTAALACQANEHAPCEGKVEICAPTAGSTFSTCIFAWGEHNCPSSYPATHIFYDEYSDTRACAECTCDPPEGSHCTATLSLYKDKACAEPIGSYPIGSEAEPYCNDLIAGTALGSKTLNKPTYLPGSCTPRGGEIAGDLALVGAATFCCLPS